MSKKVVVFACVLIIIGSISAYSDKCFSITVDDEWHSEGQVIIAKGYC